MKRMHENNGRPYHVANAEGSSWKAMYLDGFSGDTLSQAAAMARELLDENDPVRRGR